MNKFIKEVVSELHNVTWPTKQHAIRISKITIWFTLSCAVLIWTLDYVLSRGSDFLLALNPKNLIPIETQDPLSDSWSLSMSWIEAILSWSSLEELKELEKNGGVRVDKVNVKKNNNN